ncbi:hypothetical protein OOK13_29490 [Streptomyces sp. NBC_00378]|uniref:hypothetical protein n=1 Tax=unclassified Streptomyces TaxID=2593676 RepID=UPI0022585E46|nr:MULTISPECIES: hypothetical protein [unclassified Streptomyces]MCX5112536.1 hypothetical protein [Streptomyces sp. NBC_00378]
MGLALAGRAGARLAAQLGFEAATKNFTARDLTGDHDGRNCAVVLGDAVAEVLNSRGILIEVQHHHLEPQK